MDIPTEADWGDWNADLDQQAAHSVFAGKSAADVGPLFQENVIERTSEMRFMPALPFMYYMLAFRDYVLSGAARQSDAADAADSFMDLVEYRLSNDRDSIVPIVPDLLDAVDFIAANQAQYDASASIYGDFAIRRQRIRDLALG
jgi:hypothetical protein